MSNISSKVKCDACGKFKMELRFSETNLKKYKESLTRSQRNSKTQIKLPKCNECTPKNVQELTCIMCGQTKSLDFFAKQQRKKPDDAHCRDCQQEKDDREANFEDAVAEEEIIAEDRQSQINQSTHISSSASRIDRSERYETATNPASERSWANGNDAVSLDGSAYSDAPSQSSRQVTGTAWDAFNGDRNRVRSGGGSSGGFARQGAVRPTPRQRADAQIARDNNRSRDSNENVTKDSSDEEGSDDDDDAPY